MNNPEHIFSVSQLNREAKRLLASHFLTVQVQGEISNLSLPSSGHYYFTLKDAQAQIRCAMFKGQQQRLRFKPANGNLVVATAQVSLYEPRGDYQLVVEQLEEAGDGALRLAYERLKLKLLQEGLFEQSRKKPIPQLPTQIGVITSASGAAIHDILSVLKRRFPAIPVLIYPVAVQGDSAKFEISAALETANKHELVDVIILARGGGSLEDLWAFNEEIVARAVAASHIPVISAVGHEVDFSIADFVADLRAPTPSAAAEHAVPDQSAWLNRFSTIERQLTRQIQGKLQQQQLRLTWLNKALQTQHPGEKLQRNAQRLDELEQRLNRAIQGSLQQRRQQLALNEHRLYLHQPLAAIHGYRQQLDYFQQRLSRSMQIKLMTLKSRQHAAAQTLHAVSPLATLERGYAIVQRRDSSQLIKSVKQLAKHELLDTRLTDGRIVSEVKEVIPD
ncbi:MULTISPECIES: exodeoxyribonuclease VII large subunit [Methylomonas]|uniref:Exodeoxyribonuclease 7 large subunit n=2 Tax=Methylomonas TaxID=416 RepID=A0A140E6J5_9GAMM|nr:MULTISPECIES: exodeoxyribonuclease VII large subunit [Methylomonas]AMK79019.1 exodeoxyribonuclease VII large subunit [Methylomonas denitrificans]OAH96927.1 exodeoxyribonuclease VII large subunit [Methylomonas methanica]TCV74239.1 exodeoxyribonuclease VII large subunit [Methylomonas methanica]